MPSSETSDANSKVNTIDQILYLILNFAPLLPRAYGRLTERFLEWKVMDFYLSHFENKKSKKNGFQELGGRGRDE